MVQYSYGTTGASLGKLESMTYPSGARVNYRYDAGGRVNSVTVNPSDGSGGTTTLAEVPLLTDIAYTPTGNVQSWRWGNSALPAYQRMYDLDGRLTSYPIDLLGTVRTVTYNAASLVTAYTHAGGPNPTQYDQTFNYDMADRLTSFTLGGVTTAYTYDANDNRTQQTGPNVTYSYSTTSNRLSSATFSVPRTYTYDVAGNRIGDGLFTYTYSDRGRLANVGGNAVLSMYYNALGQRMLKVGANEFTNYVYDESGHTVGEYTQGSLSGIETVYLNDLPIAVLAPQGNFYVVADHIDTPLVLAQADGANVWDWRNRDPFGNNPPVSTPVLQAYDHRFPGQVADVETGLFHNYFRDYDPLLGRYVQSDPIGLVGGPNTYAYVGGNPVGLTDPTGLQAAGAGNGSSGPCFDFDKFAKQVEENRSSTAVDLVALGGAEAVGTMPKTPGELRGLGVSKSELNPYTGQLSRWSSRLGVRELRTLGRTAGGMALGTVATGALILDGFYNWGVIGKAAWDATSSGGSCGCGSK